MRRFAIWLVVVALSGCGSGSDRSEGFDRATSIFAKGFSGPVVDSSGKRIGTVTGRPDERGLVVAFDVSGLQPGRHGIHLHEAGRCDPPGFASSGQHWNPQMRRHGMDNPQGSHEGDWDNLEVAADGSGSTDRLIPRWHGKIPDAGLSLVIHEAQDDERTDPDGNSGARIACAVVIPPVS